LLCKRLQAVVPARVAANAAEHRIRTGAVALEASMLQFDSGPCWAFGDEPHFDFAGVRRIRVELPLTIGDWPIESSFGHQVPSRAVNTSKARSWDAETVICLRTTVPTY
jgi:hypothetical protein